MNWFEKVRLKASMYLLPAEARAVVRGRFEPYSFFNALTLPDAKTATYIDAFCNNDIIFAVQDWKSQKVSSIPWFVSEIKDQKSFRLYQALIKSKSAQHRADAIGYKIKALEEVDVPEITDLLAYPNDTQTGDELIYALDCMWDIAGNGLMNGIRLDTGVNKGKIRELHWLPPLWTSMTGGGLMSAPDYYQLNGTQKRMEAKDVFHIRRFNPNPFTGQDVLWGPSRLQSLLLSVIAKSKDANEYEVETFQSRGPRKIIFPKASAGVVMEDMSQEQIDSLQVHLTRKLRQRKTSIVANAVELGGLDIGSNPVELGLDQSQYTMLSKTCAVYHIRPEVVASQLASTYNNVESSRKISLSDAVLPDHYRLRDKLNAWLIPGFNRDGKPRYYLDGDTDIFPELQQSQKEKAEWLAQVALTEDERREAMGWERTGAPEMQVHTIPTNRVPARDLLPQEEVDPGVDDTY